MLNKQTLSFLFSLLLSSLLVSHAHAAVQPEKKISTRIRIAKNMVYGAAHGGLAVCSGTFCLGAAYTLLYTGSGGGGAGLNINLNPLFTAAAVLGGIPSAYCLYASLKGVYVALEDSYCALTETTGAEPETKAEKTK